MDYDQLEFFQVVEELVKCVGMDVLWEECGGCGYMLCQLIDLLFYLLFSVVVEFYKQVLKSYLVCKVVVNYLKGCGLIGEIVCDFGFGFVLFGWDNLFKYLGGDIL